MVTNPKGEPLTITFHEVLSDDARPRHRPGLRKDGVEAHLQELLAADRTPSRPGSPWCAASTRRRSARSTWCAGVDGTVVASRSTPRRDRRRRATGPLRRPPAPRLLARPGPRRVRRPGRQAPGPRARRGRGSAGSRSTTTNSAASPRRSRLFCLFGFDVAHAGARGGGTVARYVRTTWRDRPRQGRAGHDRDRSSSPIPVRRGGRPDPGVRGLSHRPALPRRRHQRRVPVPARPRGGRRGRDRRRRCHDVSPGDFVILNWRAVCGSAGRAAGASRGTASPPTTPPRR